LYPEEIDRWRPLVQWLLAIPYLLVAGVLVAVAGVVAFIGTFAILFTKRLPEGHVRPDPVPVAGSRARRTPASWSIATRRSSGSRAERGRRDGRDGLAAEPRRADGVHRRRRFALGRRILSGQGHRAHRIQYAPWQQGGAYGRTPSTLGGRQDEGAHTGVSRAAIGVSLAATVALIVATVASAALITGTPGPDTLIGTPNSDLIRGLGGNDEIRGAGDTDTLQGHAGNDTVVGGLGRDVLRGGTGHDDLTGTRDGEPDQYFCGKGIDIIRVERNENSPQNHGPGCEVIVTDHG
jgi:RTX calcium-binding nonapeptide repeat (4 copies)